MLRDEVDNEIKVGDVVVVAQYGPGHGGALRRTHTRGRVTGLHAHHIVVSAEVDDCRAYRVGDELIKIKVVVAGDDRPLRDFYQERR